MTIYSILDELTPGTIHMELKVELYEFCLECNGFGYVWIRHTRETIPCNVCSGTGHKTDGVIPKDGERTK